MCTSVKPSVVAPGGPRMPSRPVWLVFGVALSLSLSLSLLLSPLLKGVSLYKHTVIMGSFSVRRANPDVDPSFSPFRRLVPPALIRNIRARRAQQISAPYRAARWMTFAKRGSAYHDTTEKQKPNKRRTRIIIISESARTLCDFGASWKDTKFSRV